MGGTVAKYISFDICMCQIMKETDLILFRERLSDLGWLQTTVNKRSVANVLVKDTPGLFNFFCRVLVSIVE